MKTFITIESKLSTEERKNLPDELFGLPRERKYPLTDEEHVRKAIQFFRYAPPRKRNELANNINKRAVKLGMKLRISKDSPFYKYADKSILIESYGVPEELVNRLIESGTEEIQEILDKINQEFGLSLSGMFDQLFDKSSIDAIKKIEIDMQKIFDLDGIFYNKSLEQVKRKVHCINPFKLINNAMKDSYKMIFKFIEYNSDFDTKNSRLIYDIIEDISFSLGDSILINNKEKFDQQFTKFKEIINNYPCNYYHVRRKLIELYFTSAINLIDNEVHDSTKPEMYTVASFLSKVTSDINDVLLGIKDKLEDSVIVIDPNIANSYINSINERDFKLSLLKTNLKTLKKELDNEIDIIKMAANIDGSDSGLQMSFFSLDDLVNFADAEIINTITYLDSAISDENIKMYNKHLTTKLDGSDLLFMNKTNKYQRLFVAHDYNNEPIYFGVCKDRLYLLTKDERNDKDYYLLVLYKNGEKLSNDINLICREIDFDKSHSLKAIKISPINKELQEFLMNPVTEGFFIDENGNIKFKFKPRKTYMDEYAENHKILVMNSKGKNYEGMKNNLAFLFALINQIERDVIHGDTSKFSKEYIENAKKARMFAINDFKTYMKEIQKAEPNFDFMKYYEESDYGKFVVSVKKEEIVGLKKLLRTILYS